MSSKYTTTILVFLSFLTGGCAMNRANLVEEGVTSLEKIPSKYVSLWGTGVYQDDNNFIISGNVKHRYLSPFPVTGHVDVAVLESNGKVLHQQSVSYFPRWLKRRSSSSFKVTFNEQVPRGSAVRVTYHNAMLLHDQSDCGQNRAAISPEVRHEKKSTT